MKFLIRVAPSLSFIFLGLATSFLSISSTSFGVDISLGALYFWFLFYPYSIPLSVLFGFGIFQDMMTGSLMGMHAFLYFVVMGFVYLLRKRFAHKSFSVIWTGFLGLCLFVLALKWVLLSFSKSAFYPLESLCFQSLFGIFLFPLVARICMYIYGYLIYETQASLG